MSLALVIQRIIDRVGHKFSRFDAVDAVEKSIFDRSQISDSQTKAGRGLCSLDKLGIVYRYVHTRSFYASWYTFGTVKPQYLFI